MSVGQASLSRGAPARWGWINARYARLALLLLALLAALPAAPVFNRTPGADRGAALSLGAEILRRRVLYRDLWTNDPPLAAVLHALGLVLGGAGRWGVWALEFLSILAAALLLYALLKRYFGLLPALFGAAALLLNLVFVYPGSAVEGYALALQVGAYYLLSGIARNAKPLWRSLVIGLLLGLLFSLRLELLGTALTSGLLLLGMAVFTRTSRPLLHLLVMALGLLVVLAGWAVFFAAQGALPSLLDQVFRFNFFYSGVTNLARLNALAGALKDLYWASGFFAVGALSWLVTIPFLSFNVQRFREVLCGRWMGIVPLAVGLLLLFNGLWDDRSGGLYDFSALSSYRFGLIAAGLLLAAAALPFLTGWAERWGRALSQRYPVQEGLPVLLFPLALALLDLPVQIAAASLAGAGAAHHFVPVLPSLALLTAFLIWSLRVGGRETAARQNGSVWLALAALPLLCTGLFATVGSLQAYGDTNLLRIAEEIRASTPPDQPILQWGENPQLYFLANRPSASRYLQQQPLFRPGYVSAERVQAFVEDLYAAPPVILVDTRPADMPLVMAAAQDCENLQYDDFVEQAVRAERDARFPLLRGEPLPYYPPQMKAVYRWLCENYEPVPTTSTAPDAWRLYRLHPGKP